MTVDYYLAIDPGMATGVAIGRVTEDEPMEVIYKAIIQGGVYGFAEWLYNSRNGKSWAEEDCSKNFPDQYASLDWHINVVCETFRVMATQFTPNVEALRIEGVVMSTFPRVIEWHKPSDKVLVGDEFLKKHGLWVTGKDVGHSDGRDANDAMLHLFAHALKLRHQPTIKQFWRNNDKSN